MFDYECAQDGDLSLTKVIISCVLNTVISVKGTKHAA